MVSNILDGKNAERKTKTGADGKVKYLDSKEEETTTWVSDLIQWKAMDTLKQSITTEGLKGFKDPSSDNTSRWVEEILEDV